MPTSLDIVYNERYWPEYAEAVRAAGGDAIRIPLSSSLELRKLIMECDGYVLPGSPADVDPVAYGQMRAAETAVVDKAREECDTAVLEYAERSGKPLLAICFGLQSLNVWRGGSLVQDLQPLPVNHGAGAQVAVAHSVLVVGQSLLGGLLSAGEAPASGQFRRLPVNSSHHQAVSISGEDLTVVARSAEDGVIEAVEGRIGASAMIGVQWHPERSVGISAASRALFLWLTSAAEDAHEDTSGEAGAYDL